MNPTITIYNYDGTAFANVLITKNAVHEEELMRSNHIRLQWDSVSKAVIPAGSYILWDNIKWRLLEPYEPEQKREDKFSYEPEFQHPVMRLSKVPMFHLYNDVTSWASATHASDWTYYGPAGNLISAVVQYINLWGNEVDESLAEDLGSEWLASISEEVTSKVISCSFNGNDILSVCNQIAQKAECEYIFDLSSHTLRFGTLSLLPATTLKTGVNVGVASVSLSREEYYNRYVVKGGANNLSQPTQSGFERATERLTLDPTEYPDSIIDLREGDEPMLTGELVFDDVYPKLQLYVYGVRERRCYKEDEDGHYTDEIYSKWYIRLAYRVTTPETGKTPVATETVDGTMYYWYDYIVEDEDRIKDTDLQISFIPNTAEDAVLQNLVGQTFGVVPFLTNTSEGNEDNAESDYNEEGEPFPVYAGDYRIQFNEENGYIIPTTAELTMYPHTVDGNTPSVKNNLVSIIGVVVSDELKSAAQTELKQVSLTKINRLRQNLNSYTMKSMSDVFMDSEISLELGGNVIFNDGQDLNGGESLVLSTHIRKLVTRLDNPYSVEITVGNEKIEGPISSMKSQIESILNAGGGGGGSMLTENQFVSLLTKYGNTMYLSKTIDDKASGLIGFLKGFWIKAKGLWGFSENGEITASSAEVSGKSKLLGGVEVGEFQSRFLGKGAAVDAQGNAEFDSIYSRNFISTPEFRFNRIAVTDGEDWCTNGYGTIKEVSNIHTEGDEVVGHAVLHLEENDWASIREGDICRGIFNDIAGEYTEYSSEETGEDDCDIYGAGEDDMQEGHGFGFANKKGFFTSYFYVKHITKNVAGECEFDFGMRTSTTPLPCAFMKFAQYGSFTDSDRQSSSYRSSIGNFFEMTLQGVNTWRIQPENVVARYGWLGDMTITERDGTTRTLEGNGLYVQDNVYFGGGVVQLDPATIEDLADELASYEVDFSEHVDVIQVDDAGNVIGGLWEDSTDGTSTYRNYRIQSAITVRKNGVLLTEAASSADAGKGTFKLYATSHDCTFEISNSTIYIKGINNVKDGVPGSSDDVNFDYDAMREMESVSVDLVVDCEGRGSITKTFAVAIKHTATPFIQQSLDNVSANVSWSVKLQEFIGIPVHIGVRMMKDTVSLPLTYLAIRVGDTIYTQTGTKAAGASSETAGTAHLLSHTSANVGKGNGWRFEISKSAKEIYITDMPVDVDEYPSISILSSVEYAGVTYENESAFTLHKMEDVNVYELWPSQPDIKQHYSYAIGANNAVSRTPVMELLGNALTAIVSCDDSEGRHYQTSASDLANAGLSVWYALVNAADVEGTKTAMPSAGLTASDIGSAKRVILYLYRNKGQATESVEDYQPVDVLSPTDDYWMELTDNFAVLDEDDNAVVPSSITISPMRRPGTPVEGTLVFRVGTDTTVRHEIEVTSSTSYKGVITSTYLLSLVNRAITQGTSDIHVLLYTDHNKTTLLAVTKIRAMLSAKGDDGPGVEYIFQRTATADGTADAPTYPSSGTAPVNSGTGTVDGVDTEYSNIIDDWVPPAWDDDALSPTAALPYVWASKRKKSNGTWGNFETPKLWNKWAEDGATYDIKTSVDTLAILPDESSVDFMSSIRVYKIQGDVSSLFTCYIQVFKRKPDGTRESIYGPVQHTSAGINRNITDAYEAVEIFASESDTNLTTNYLWKKEIPVIKHGDTGEDAASYRCSWKHAGEEVDVLHADSDGSVQAKSAGSIVVTLKKRVGDGAEENGGATNVIVYAEEADGTVYDSFTASANAITISSSSELDSIDESSVVRLRAVFTVGSETIEFVINKVLDGAHGDLGPMLYPAGEWQANTTYTKNGQQVPYVLYNGSYYYLAVDSSNRSSWHSTDWTLVSSFNAVFAQFLIADYGKMSSAIFCGDWCYSQYGKLMTGNGGYYIVDNNGSTSGHINYDASYDGKLPYMYFDPSDPTGSGATTGYPRFAPAWAVDFKTGAQYGAMGKFKLKDDGSVEIEGVVKAQSFQQSVVDCYYTGNGRQSAYESSVLLPSQMSDYSENTVFPWLSGNTIRNSMIWDGVSVPSKLYIEDTDSPNNGGSTEIDGQSVVLRSYIYLNLPPACDHLGHEIEIITRVSQAGLSNLEYRIKGGTGPSSEDKLIVPGLGPSSYIYLNPDPNRHRQFISSGGKISSVRLIAVQWSTYYGWMVLGYNEAYLG